MNRAEEALAAWPAGRLPAALADRTRRIYDHVSAVYPLSSMLFHTRAHRCLLRACDLTDGMNVLEVATGSGEMFRRLVAANRGGATIGMDLSPRMAARTERAARRRFPQARAHCQAVDVRHLPYRDASFDAVFCCYLFELLPGEDIARALREVWRVLRGGGSLGMVLIGRNERLFNAIYGALSKAAPQFWGRQVEHRIEELAEFSRFRVVEDRTVRQCLYPSRVMVARKQG